MNAVTGSAVRALRQIADMHSKHSTEEIEIWHEPLFGEDCPDGDCDGHVEQIEVCNECGTSTHPEFDVWYRPWPCPTLTAARAALDEVAS